MQRRLADDPRQRIRPVWVVLLAAGLIVGIAMGLRQVMGLYLKPMTTELNIGREPFSLAMAIANLVWGLAAVPMGAIADRYGSGRILVIGAISTMAGVYLMYVAQSEIHLLLSGILVGIGVGGTGITALVGAVGRAVPPEKRPQAIAALGMASGIGSFVAFPYIHLFIELLGWKGSLLVTIGTLAIIIPLAIPLVGKPTSPPDVPDDQSLVEAFSEAFSLPSFWLLTFGFFVCGFHVAFYGVHLPAFVADQGLPAHVAVAALTAVGVANIVGTYLSGQSTKFFPKRYSLSFIYAMRCTAFLGLLFLPINAVTVIGISTVLGLFWLSTVPLTSAMVATFFGPQWMSMLFGFVFLSHQLGSFVGLWLAGILYDATNSYDMMWWISIGLALFAAVVHLPIRERPVPRLVGDAVNHLRVKITPYFIDLGTKVVQLSHVTSAGVGADYPLRPIALLLVAVAMGLMGMEMLDDGIELHLPAIDSPMLWIACAATGFGLCMFFVARRLVVIRSVDGSVTKVPEPDRRETEALVARISRAMDAASETTQYDQLELAATDAQTTQAIGHVTTTPSVPPALEADRLENRAGREPGRELRDLTAIMATIERTDVPHKDGLLALLQVVEGHYHGTVSLEDAETHWIGFADYVRQHLRHLDVLQAQTDSFDQILQSR
ncbi:MAG: MFS transporter [Hyphomicrobiaceae bacterium]